MYDGLDLNVVWFWLVGILFTGYAILDGFDLGVGALHLLAKTDTDRRNMLNTIGPVWDGNEVWLVTGGGALFAAFPDVYATAFSGLYIPFMLLLVSLIFRAIAIEFRSKMPMTWWRTMWDVLFSAGSMGSALLLGVTVGNLALGLPVGADKEMQVVFLELLNPYALLVGVTTVALFMMHASIYVVMKTEGALQAQARGWVKHLIALFVTLYVFTTMATLLYVPHMSAPIQANPWLFLLAVGNMLCVANVPRELYYKREFAAFFSSCLSIVFLLALFGVGMFPNLITSNIDPAFSLNLYNASSSQATLEIMLTIALMAVPLILAYTASIYWIFRGKVKLEQGSY
jgi:cytochrome d ubiquinol oxidase subunit II